MNELFTKEQIADLHKHFGAFERVDPCSETWLNFVKFLEGLPTVLLNQLAGADIKWMSGQAKRILKEKRNG